MSVELLPCPFCGNPTPEFERLGDRRQSCIVVCGQCGCRHESSDEGEHNGSSWNRRAQPWTFDALHGIWTLYISHKAVQLVPNEPTQGGGWLLSMWESWLTHRSRVPYPTLEAAKAAGEALCRER